MKILVTGMCNGQAGAPPRPGYVTLADCLTRLLMALGHDVDNRPVAIGEDLSGYGIIFCGLFSPFSVNGKWIFSVVDMLDRCWNRDEQAVATFVDDWTLHQIDQNSRSTYRVPKRLIRDTVFDRRPGYDWACSAEGQSAIVRLFTRVTETGWPPMIMPVFGWGNPRMVMKEIMAEQYWPLDPTAYMPVHSAVYPDERKRAWVLATMQDHAEWWEKIHPEWEVITYGGGMTKRKADPVPVTEVFQAYADCRGVLSPPYSKLLGAGWWRERMVHAAMTRAVLCCDPREAPQLGEPYALTLEAIEAMTDSQLDEAASAQAAALRHGCWDGTRLHAEAEVMIQALASHDSASGMHHDV